MNKDILPSRNLEMMEREIETVDQSLISINIIAFITIIRKESTRILRLWLQTIFPPLITIFLYLVIFGELIGSRLGEIRGVQYMEFIIPGLILMSVLINSYTNVVTSFYSQKFARSIEELLVAPVYPFVIVSGFIVGGLFRGFLIASVLLILAYFFHPYQIHSYFWFFFILMLAIVLFALIGFANALFANKFDDVTIIPTFILTPMTYLGGIFYSVKELPTPWRELSSLNPLFYLVDAFRYAMTGLHETNLASSALIIVIMISLMGSWDIWALRRGYRLKS